MPRRGSRVLGAVLALVVLAGCGGNDGPGAAPTTPRTAPEPPSAPPAKACYDLPFRAALQPTNDATPVPCTAKHTTETLYVGRIDPLVDGHLLAVDSARVQSQIADTCRRRLARRIGGDEEDRRLSRVQAAWFSPTLTQSEAGALWFRCDLVFVAGPKELAELPRTTKGLLDRDGALRSYGTCGTASPAAKSFKRVACSRPHSWRARATIDLPEGAKYLDKAAAGVADGRCRDLDARIASDELELKWSFEWPTREQWQTGQRYGICWTPDPA